MKKAWNVFKDKILPPIVVVSIVYFALGGLFNFLNATNIIPYLAKKDLCHEYTDKEIQSIKEYQIWDHIWIYDVFVPDMINEIDLGKCDMVKPK